MNDRTLRSKMNGSSSLGEVRPEIQKSPTLPGAFYSDLDLYERLKEVFARSWLLAGHEEDVRTPGTASPLTLLPGFLNEPLVLVRDHDDKLRCLSNVCTHRGMLVVEAPCHLKRLRCRYHARRFELDGRCIGMPEFEEVEGFPGPEDDLRRLPLEGWAGLLFTSLDPSGSFEEVLGPVMRRLSGFPLEEARPYPDIDRDYTVRANWAVYCDNYLESFHVPFVHPGLAETLDYKEVEIELFPWGSLQVGAAASRDLAFEWPASSRYYGRDIAALYFHIFPNLMLNFYPWGLSLNLVEPLTINRTRIRFRTYVVYPERLHTGAGAALDRTEREDEEIVEAVQIGTASRFYRHGRYSPRQEKAVHHFHRLLVRALAD